MVVCKELNLALRCTYCLIYISRGKRALHLQLWKQRISVKYFRPFLPDGPKGTKNEPKNVEIKVTVYDSDPAKDYTYNITHS